MNKQRLKIFAIIAGIVAAVALVVLLFLWITAKPPEKTPSDDPTPSPGVTQGVEDPSAGDSTETPGEEDDDPVDEEVNVPIPVGTGNCDNSKVLTLEYPKLDGTTGAITAGLGAEELSDYLYLNLKCSEATAESEIGFYVTPTRGLVEYNEARRGDRNDEVNAGEANFMIVDRFYNDVVPSAYQDEENFGLRWRDDLMEGGEFNNDSFLLRAVNIHNGSLVGIFRLTMAKDANTGIYSFDKLENVNDEAVETLPEEVREDMLAQLLTYIPERVWTNLAEDEKASNWDRVARDGAIFHCTNSPYFGRFLKSGSRKVGRWFNYLNCKDLVILTVPVSGYDYLSAYFAPAAELKGESISLQEVPAEEWHYTLFAYDPPLARNVSTLAAPSAFFDP